MGPVDTIWLNMDRPTNLMVIHALLLLQGRLAPDRLQALLEARLLRRYPVFRQRVVRSRLPIGLPRWEDDPDFALDRHVHRASLPAPGDDAALRTYVDGRLHLPLDAEHPLWEIHVLDGYHGSGSVVFCRFHHALADGIALIRVLISLTDATPDQGPPDETPPEAVGPTARDTTGGVAGPSIVSTAVAVGSAGLHAVESMARGGTVALKAVGRLATPHGARRTVGLGLRAGLVVMNLLFAGNRESPLGGTPGVDKHVVWSQPFPLGDLKEVGRSAGATLNDVLMSAVAGALGRYIAGHGGQPIDLTTMVPINVRDLGVPLPPGLGNRFALVFFRYPSSIAGVRERLAETKRRMDWVKTSPEASITFQLIRGIGRTRAEIERVLVDFFANKAVGVTTNVPGPATARYLAGARVTGMLGWVPGSAHQTLGVCILTYAGTVRVGFLVDAERVRDPDDLVDGLNLEIEELIHPARPT
jgi:WS/DGAT/MGAT family acyltransferase